MPPSPRRLQAAVAKAVAASSPGTASAAAANPYSVVSASSVDPTAAATGGYIFPVRFATIKVDAQAPAGDVVAALMAQPGVTGVYPNTIYTTQQGALAGLRLRGGAPLGPKKCLCYPWWLQQ
jgi:hypothetical protein